MCERAEDRKGERENIEEEGKGDERGQDSRSKKDCMWGCASLGEETCLYVLVVKKSPFPWEAKEKRRAHNSTYLSTLHYKSTAATITLIISQ